MIKQPFVQTISLIYKVNFIKPWKHKWTNLDTSR